MRIPSRERGGLIGTDCRAGPYHCLDGRSQQRRACAAQDVLDHALTDGQGIPLIYQCGQPFYADGMVGWSGLTANPGSSPAGASAVTRSPQQARRPPNRRTWVTSSLIGSKVQYSVCKPLYALQSRIKCFTRIKCFIGHLKEQRRIATQFDKSVTSFLGFVLLGMHYSLDQVCP